jgi:hypothetical protein
MKRRICLDQVTMVCVSGVNIKKSIYALWRSSRRIKFQNIKLITNKSIGYTPKWLSVELAKESSLNTLDSYSHYCVYSLHKHIQTNYVLIVQADGYVINSKKWDDRFLNYDYIGAPWKIRSDSYIDPFGNHHRVGNGGFSLRSRKLLELPLSMNIVWNVNNGAFYKHMNVNDQAEDGIICIHNRHLYIEGGCVFAPFELALLFSKEQNLPENYNLNTFGYHKRLPSFFTKLVELNYKLVFNLLFLIKKL